MTSTELGNYVYELNLKSLPAPPEKPTTFTSPLGGSITQNLRLTYTGKNKADFTIKLDSSEFRVEKTISITPGNHISIIYSLAF